MKNLEELEGVGPKTCELFHKLGIVSIEDLILYYPRKYQILKPSDMATVKDGDKVIIEGIVEGQPTVLTSSPKLKRIVFRISNSSHLFRILVYNQLYLCRELKYGTNVMIIGKYDQKGNTIIATEVRIGKLPEHPQAEPIYSITEGLSRKVITKFIDSALQYVSVIEDKIPDTFQKKYHFPNKSWSIIQVHHPSDALSYKRAIQRLKYEEFFEYLWNIQNLKKKRLEEASGLIRNFPKEKLQEFIANLKFELTIDQLETVQQIEKDLVSKKRMNRLIQGDVGSGKTIVAFIASYINFLSGYQTALMVPTEILATQHYKEALDLFSKTDMKISLLTSSITLREKKKIYKKLEDGELDFIIGTQSLIQEKVKYTNLGLIVTDEQHRFGVHQREELKNKGTFPDVLSMSATPIPRTYALTIYGDMDISSIKTKPSGRQDVITHFKKEQEMMDVLHLMKKELDLNHQIYVIAPAIEASGEKDLNNVDILFEKMRLAFGKIAKIGVVHGKLDNNQKEKMMQEFASGDIHILISTTVIEVGVNVPNASMIVIFQANLFGLSTLHQLRGRVGRGSIQSYCILIAKEYNERLKMLENCSDGFKISEYDFKSRGEGDLFGVKQSGNAHFRLANVQKDFELLVRVKQDVEEFVSSNEICKY